ncbi:MAG: hypothetical protein N3D11_12535 [Candidatus Sumerlaeia bacterium]|nr:hypothetical protein [Candidatus Sumerlaeia bacterium]
MKRCAVRGLAFLVINGCLLICTRSAPALDTLSLAGRWRFRLDPQDAGVTERWYAAQRLPETVRLPGSTDENGKGTLNTRPPDYNYLSRIVEYVGPAWYQRDVTIPATWRDRRITLFLERCHWETRVWVDGVEAGVQDSLSVPHIYDLTQLLPPGRHRIVIRVDNSHKYDMGRNAHSTSEQTQSNWNGIVGRIELRAADPVGIEDIQVYPNVSRKTARVVVRLYNVSGRESNVQMRWNASPVEGGGAAAKLECGAILSSDARSAVVEHDLPMGDGCRLWDEFSPALYRLNISLSAQCGDKTYTDRRAVTFGMREISTTPDKRIQVNGRNIFLRGTLECCIFPLTGYPPTDVESWRRILKTCQSYGLNHMRFHSWCPPEAAFVAADELGILFHVEAPCWILNWGKDAKRDAWIEQEAARILREYGNHPSFAMFCMGNEPGGDRLVPQKIISRLKPTDSRRLYLAGAGWGYGPDDDYCVLQVRGLHGPTTDFDFRAEDAKHDKPVVSHEIGQWAVYPNLAEMAKYTGVLRPRNFQLIRDDLAKKHLLDLADEFLYASGKLSVLLYKEEIEVLMRTPGHGGFQLLDLHDFPGQGTALVGALDAFWDSKGLITPREYRRFCSPTVPLLRMAKRTYTSGEMFSAKAEILHFGQAPIENAVPVWSIKDERGREVASGVFPARTIPVGQLSELGVIETPLARVNPPAKLTVSLSIQGTHAFNTWDLWVYPVKENLVIPGDVTISRAWDAATQDALARGGKVLLFASASNLAQSLPGSFTPVFWSPIWFRRGAGTMGILCNPKHPALAKFPTEFHTNWQWYDLLEQSRTMILDNTPADFRPIVQVIDNFSRNHKLGNLFEARVGKGRLLVCSMDLLRDQDRRPAARQMYASLIAYLASDAFRPKQELTSETLGKLFAAPEIKKIVVSAKPDLPAVLHVKAAGAVKEMEKSAPWTAAADRVLARETGYDYKVRGGTWRDKVGTAWHSADDLRVTITCPKGFAGTLYAHFHDWNNKRRVTDIFFEDQPYGMLSNYAGAGLWLAFPVTAKDSADGVLELSARPTQFNTMITEVVLVKQ